jgi:hypothetical protein
MPPLDFDACEQEGTLLKKVIVSTVLLAASAFTSSAWAQIGLPTNAAALTNANRIFVLNVSAQPVRTINVSTSIGNLIGIDYRVADNKLYGVTDTGGVYTIDFRAADGAPRLVSRLTARFDGGNPVVNALRVIGANEQNFGVVNANGGNLNMTAPQTPLAYVAGDRNFGADPSITAGAYSNNFAGATSTIFYMADASAETLVTIADLNATGSSNTAGGKLKTIGPIVDGAGAPVNVLRAGSGLDIHTLATGINIGILVSGGSAYVINLQRIDLNAPVGTLQNVIARRILTTQENFIDVAVITVPIS